MLPTTQTIKMTIEKHVRITIGEGSSTVETSDNSMGEEPELLLPEPVPSIMELDQKRYAQSYSAQLRSRYSPTVEEDIKELTYSPLEKHRLCRQASVWRAANQLLRSHIYMATGAAWAIAENIIIWTSKGYYNVRDHPDMAKVQVDRIAIDGEERRRPFDMMELGGYKYAMSPALSELRFDGHPYWKTIGLQYKVGQLPLVGRCAWLEVDHKETLMPENRVNLLYLIDGDFKKTVAPISSKRMRKAILKVFDEEFIEKTFPEIAKSEWGGVSDETLQTVVAFDAVDKKTDDAVDKDEETKRLEGNSETKTDSPQ